jgi:CubicO group peptidase (beta-lactamase class C family)
MSNEDRIISALEASITALQTENKALLFSRLTDFLQKEYIDTKKLPGLSFHVAHKGEVVYEQAIGVRDLASGEPWEIDTLHNIASMTKSMVTVALMTLYEEGKFQLDDPVSKYVPNFNNDIYVSGTTKEDLVTKPSPTPVTIRHCLTHTCGLSYFFVKSKVSPHSVTDTLGLQFLPAENIGCPGSNIPDDWAAFSKCPLAFEPGTGFRYGIGMDVVGHLVAVIGGKALDTFLAERVLHPLGMSDTLGYHISDEALAKGNVATMYCPSDADQTVLEEMGGALAGFQNKTLGKAMQATAGLGGHSGGGNIISSSRDAFKFARMLSNKGTGVNGAKILKPETVALMMSNNMDEGKTLSDPTFNTHIADAAEVGKGSGCCVAHMDSAGLAYGLGGAVVVNPAESTPFMGPCSKGTFGWLGIFKTEYWVDPVEDLAVCVHSQVLWGEFFGMGNKDGMYLPEFRSVFATKVYEAIKGGEN